MANPNRAEFSAQELVHLYGEEALIHISNTWRSCGVSTDTRSLQPGNLFIALRGETTDGHRYLEAAHDLGAAAALVEVSAGAQYSPLIGRLPLIVVPDTLQALGALAAFHRQRFSIPVVAIAGAAGKTTTKEMTAAVLSTQFNVLKTEGNKNNRIGAPLTLLGITSEHTAAVVEIGTNEPGEIAVLSDIVAPTHGLITNIGKEHLEKLIDLDGVEREETTLFAYLFGNRGVAFINTDDERLRAYERSSGCVTFGLHGQPRVRAEVSYDVQLRPVLRLLIGDTTTAVQMQATGETAARNAVAAAAVGHALGLSAEQVKTGLQAFRPVVGAGYARMAVEYVGGITLLNDCYNANPTSMEAALATLKAMHTGGKKIAVLGDMRELGAASAEEHFELLLRTALNDNDIHTLLLLGTEMHKALERYRSEHSTDKYIKFCASNSDCVCLLADQLSPGDVVLVKGSRGMKLEEVVSALQQGISNAPKA